MAVQSNWKIVHAPKPRGWLVIIAAVVMMITCAPQVRATPPEAGTDAEAPVASAAPKQQAKRFATSQTATEVGAAAVDNDTRAQAESAYREQLKSAVATPTGWTGNVGSCVAGQTSAAAHAATLRAINYVRGMVGLQDVAFEATRSAKSQEAALIMKAQGALNHNPPSTWPCWTQTGWEGAQNSNLAIGRSAAGAITLYMDDPNVPSLGHRRWLLYPQTTVMGSGSTDSTNAVWVVNNDEVFGPVPTGTPDYLAWPDAGYFPMQLVPSQLWSFSSTKRLDLSQATVRVRKNGTTLPVTMQHPEPLGYGPTIVSFSFTPGYAGGATDQAFEITIQGMRDSAGTVLADYTYTTTLFDPEYIPPSAQTITFAQPSATTYGGQTTVAATASSGMPVTFTSTTPTVCTISGTRVTSIDTGTCTIRADQAGSASWLAAPPVTRSITIGKATLEVTGNGTFYAGNVSTMPTTFTGFVRGETLATSDVRGSADCQPTGISLDDSTPSGSYLVECAIGGLTSDHYGFTPRSGTLTLNAGLIPVTPVRLVDTRTGQGVGKARVAGRSSVTFQVSGGGGVPDHAAAVALNITSVNPAAGGYLTVYASDAARPVVSTLNLDKGKNVANVTLVQPGSDGRVTIYNGGSGAVDLVVDLQGFLAGTSNGHDSDLVSVAGTRLLDTRLSGGIVGSGQTRQVQVAGVAGVPVTASSVLVNLTAVAPARNGYVQGYPTGSARPVTSSLNYTAGVTRANLVSVPVGSSGTISLYNSGGTVHLLADVVGYAEGAPPEYAGEVGSVTPTRVLDTRQSAIVPANGSVTVQVAGVAGVPADGSAAVINLTAVNAGRSGYLTAYPTGATRPTTSNVNFEAGRNTAGFTVARVGTNGRVTIYNGSGAPAHILIDVSGYVVG